MKRTLDFEVRARAATAGAQVLVNFSVGVEASLSQRRAEVRGSNVSVSLATSTLTTCTGIRKQQLAREVHNGR